MEELIEDFEILIDAWLKSDNEDITILANSLAKQAEKALLINGIDNCKHVDYTPCYGREGELMFRRCDICGEEFD